jgi:RNA polymerase sigma-70 factor (ECF subfamily)
MTGRSEQDEWLMGQVALGKRDCLEPLVRRYASPLLTYIRRMVGDRHRSEELFQEVFLAVWTKRKQYKFPRSFRAWLFAIATNQCRAAFRRVNRETVSLELVDSPPSRPDSSRPVDTAIATETAGLVSVAVAQLPPRQRSVVVLRVWNGLAYSEIADVLGCSEGSARSHMHHALAGLRRFLEPRL